MLVHILLLLHAEYLSVTIHLLNRAHVVRLVVGQRLWVQDVQALAHFVEACLSALDSATASQTIDIINTLNDHIMATWLLNHRPVRLLHRQKHLPRGNVTLSKRALVKQRRRLVLPRRRHTILHILAHVTFLETAFSGHVIIPRNRLVLPRL